MNFQPAPQRQNVKKAPVPVNIIEEKLEHAPPQVETPRPSVEVSTARFYCIMISIWIGNITAFYNETTVTTAQHSIASQFNDLPNMNWVATSYLLGFTVTQTLLGKFSDIFGRSAVFNGTLIIFAVGTLWCGLAQSMNSLIGARLLQGIGAAGRHSVGSIVVIDLTTPDNRGMWLGLFSISLGTGLAIGPILGAVLSVHSTWRWLFWITLILCGITFVIGVSSMNYPVPHLKQEVDVMEGPEDVGFIGRYPVSDRRQAGGILAKLKEVDFIGSILVVAISSAICIAIEMGNKEFPWGSAPIVSLFVAGVTLIPTFVLYELKIAKNPVIDIHLFSIRNIPLACLMNFTTGAAYFGAIFFLPRYFIDIKNSSLITAGVQMFGIIFAFGISCLVGANLISKTGQLRLVGLVGGALYALGSGVMLLITRETPSARVIGWSVIMGFGSGILYQPSLVVGPMSVKPHQMAGISGFLSFLRTLGGTFATALLTAIFETRLTHILRGKIPDELVNQGLGLADNHSQYPKYSDAILNAMIKAYHDGSIPGILLGVLYAVAVACLQNIDFVPAWKRQRIAAKNASLMEQQRLRDQRKGAGSYFVGQNEKVKYIRDGFEGKARRIDGKAWS